MTTGRQAEEAVAQYLITQGFRIVDKNWRTKAAEIDIIIEKKHKIFFVEVKYRSSAEFGSGLEYITPNKLSRMRFGCELWVNSNKWSGDYQLLVASVSGANFEEIEIIELEV